MARQEPGNEKQTGLQEKTVFGKEGNPNTTVGGRQGFLEVSETNLEKSARGTRLLRRSFRAGERIADLRTVESCKRGKR